jgi:alpha-glucosidase
LLGDSLLVAPVTRPGAEYRHVYIPAGSWFHYWTGARVDGPAHILAHAPLGQPAIYVKANTAVPLWPEMNHVGEREADPLTFVLYPGEGNDTAPFYEDAGDGYEYLNGAYARRVISCEADGAEIRVGIGEQVGKFVPARRHIRLELREIASKPVSVRLGNASVASSYDTEQRRLVIDLHETAAAKSIIVSMA